MKKVSVYRPTTIEEASSILSRHGGEAAVYAGGTDLLIRLKNLCEARLSSHQKIDASTSGKTGEARPDQRPTAAEMAVTVIAGNRCS
jgi:CO/xanthine dehydrogenase FAD-binding subunit